MGKFDLDSYEMVQDRLPKFYEKYVDGRVVTQLVSPIEKVEEYVVFKAYLYTSKEDMALNCPLATGFAYEKFGEGYINKTSHVENCETSAIGRALANITMHGSKRPSREEMQKVEKMNKEEKEVTKPKKETTVKDIF